MPLLSPQIWFSEKPWSLLKVRDSSSKMSVENIKEKPLGRGISRPACATSFPGFYPTVPTGRERTWERGCLMCTRR